MTINDLHKGMPVTAPVILIESLLDRSPMGSRRLGLKRLL